MRLVMQLILGCSPLISLRTGAFDSLLRFQPFQSLQNIYRLQVQRISDLAARSVV